jgi:hypothetical protein
MQFLAGIIGRLQIMQVGPNHIVRTHLLDLVSQLVPRPSFNRKSIVLDDVHQGLSDIRFKWDLLFFSLCDIIHHIANRQVKF